MNQVQNCKQLVLIASVVDNSKSAKILDVARVWNSLTNILGETKHYQILSLE